MKTIKTLLIHLTFLFITIWSKLVERFQGNNRFESNDTIINDKCKFVTVSTDYIEKQLSPLSVAKATRFDTISNSKDSIISYDDIFCSRYLKLTAPVVTPSVIYLMNMSLQSGKSLLSSKELK